MLIVWSALPLDSYMYTPRDRLPYCNSCVHVKSRFAAHGFFLLVVKTLTLPQHERTVAEMIEQIRPHYSYRAVMFYTKMV